jgi:uncharacterized protein (DUF4415 family)
MRISRNKKSAKQDEDPMQPHYDFSKGEKPNYAKKFAGGAAITITGSNGKTSRQKRIETKSMVVLDADVSKVFSNGKSVNAALRHLMAALPKKPRVTR